MFNSQNPQTYEICPYNPAHQILKYRMSTHLVKCRKIYHGDSSMTVCLFNANHSVPTTELKYHLENCSDRFNFDKQVLITSDVDQSKYPVQNSDIQPAENWDDDDCPSYQPDEYCKSNSVLRQAKVESAAKRKNFRVEERQRLQKMKESDTSNTNNENHKTETKFRSTALADSAINVHEESPFIFEDLQRGIRMKSAVVPNKENCENTNVTGASTSTVIHDSDFKPKDDNCGAVMRKRQGKVRKGRGRGVSR